MSSEHEKERAKAIEEVGRCGWRVVRETKRGYLVLHCSCGDHMETLKKTPKYASHFRKKAAWMVSQCCSR